MEEGLIKEIMGRVRKEASKMIWFEKRGCACSREMARAN